MGWLQQLDPMSYAVAAVRRALYGGIMPSGTGVAGSSTALELCVLAGFAVIAAALSVRLCYARR